MCLNVCVGRSQSLCVSVWARWCVCVFMFSCGHVSLYVCVCVYLCFDVSLCICGLREYLCESMCTHGRISGETKTKEGT